MRSKIFQFQELLCLVWHGLSNNNPFFFPDRFSYLRITSTTKLKWTAHQSVWCPQAVWGSYLMDLLTGSMKVKPISINNKKPRGLCACNKRAEVIVSVWCVGWRFCVFVYSVSSISLIQHISSQVIWIYYFLFLFQRHCWNIHLCLLV